MWKKSKSSSAKQMNKVNNKAPRKATAAQKADTMSVVFEGTKEGTPAPIMV
jgi:hypothetical protein